MVLTIPIECSVLTAEVTVLGTYPFAGGGFADVYRGTWLSNTGTEAKVAVKVLRLKKEEPLEKLQTRLKREVNAWHGLDDPHVLPFYGLKYGIGFEEFRDTVPGMVSPFCENGTVMSYMERQVQNGTDPKGLRSTMIAGIAQGLWYLHSNNVVHGDLKPNNVLIGDNGQPLLTDFGLSRILDVRGFTLSLQTGSTAYIAPEILWSGQDSVINQVDTRSDIYSLAITIWEIYAQKPLFGNHISPWTIFMKVAMNHYRPPRVADIEDECWDLLERCWAHEADERPAIDNVVPFFVAVNEGEA